MENKAIFKFNNGAGALLCSGCGVILKVGSEFTPLEVRAARGEIKLPPQSCNTIGIQCKRFNKKNKI